MKRYPFKKKKKINIRAHIDITYKHTIQYIHTYTHIIDTIHRCMSYIHTYICHGYIQIYICTYNRYNMHNAYICHASCIHDTHKQYMSYIYTYVYHTLYIYIYIHTYISMHSAFACFLSKKKLLSHQLGEIIIERLYHYYRKTIPGGLHIVQEYETRDFQTNHLM